MNTLDMLYTRTESGLIVPRTALESQPPTGETFKFSQQEPLTRQQRRRLEHLQKKAGSPGRARKGSR